MMRVFGLLSVRMPYFTAISLALNTGFSFGVSKITGMSARMPYVSVKLRAADHSS